MKIFPTSIVGRTVLVLLVGLTVSHFVSMAIYSGDRQTELTRFGGKQISRRIAAAVETIERSPPERRQEVAGTLWGTGFSLTLTPKSALQENSETGWREGAVRKTLMEYLEGYDAERIRIAYVHLATPASGSMMHENNTSTRSGDPLMAMQRHMGQMMSDDNGVMNKRFMSMSRRWHGAKVLEVSVRLSDDQWLNIATPATRLSSFTGSRVFTSLSVMSLLVIIISVWAVRRATAPLALFEKAAERLGRDVNAPPMNEDGPREVKRAASSFNQMQKRLKVFIDDRTQMLAAISHDLRTPITRLRLRAEFVDDEEQQKKMLDDLAQMEEMIAATLAFARDEAASEPDVRIDLSAMLQSLADDAADGGAMTTFQGSDKLPFTGRPVALRRAFQNLLDNAIKYGDRGDITVEQDDSTVLVHMDDAGPGIAEAECERVFEPFYRIEGSRNRDTGGVGLGLAVVRTVVRAHGGEIEFSALDKGFRVTVTLPKS